ncbi:MAG: SCO family protein, partial [Nitrospinota bacterium]
GLSFPPGAREDHRETKKLRAVQGAAAGGAESLSLKKLRRTVVFVTIVLAVAVAALWLARDDVSDLPVYGKVPAFSLTSAEGKTVGREQLDGYVWVANFNYTRCKETCPLQSLEIARLQKEFAAAKDLLLVSITLDPAYDTPAVLRRYAQKYGADPKRWLFLTGDRQVIADLALRGFKLAFARRNSRLPLSRAPGGKLGKILSSVLLPAPAYAHPGHVHKNGGPSREVYEISHSSRFVLVDRAGRIRGYYLSNDAKALDQLRRDIRKLL